MKRGAEEAKLVELEDLPGQSEQKNAKIGRVEKSLDELLNEVFNGQYDDFRVYLRQNNITDLDLSGKVIGSIDRPIKHLGIALQGTNVTTVNLGFNQIDPLDAEDFADCIPDTFLIKANLGFISFSRSEVRMRETLSKALEKNRDKLLFTPYRMATLRLLPNEEKNKYFNMSVDALNTEEGRLRYAGGILMRAPTDVANKILGYLPLMRSREGRLQTNNFLNIAKKYNPDGLAVEENNTDETSTICITA